MLDTLLGTGISLLFLALVFIPMEKTFPANKSQQVFRKAWLLDLCYFLGQYLFWSSAVLYALNYVVPDIHRLVPISILAAIQSQPIWLQALEVIIASDVLIYWAHRIQHSVGFLWKFHSIHHSSEHLDWLAAHREHPVDSIYTVGIINLPAVIMGFNLEALSAVIAFRGIWAIYIHSNVKLNMGWLEMLIGSPALHHWHHANNRQVGNYANVSPLMDKLFGTYSRPPQEPAEFGIDEKLPQSYVKQLVYPFTKN